MGWKGNRRTLASAEPLMGLNAFGRTSSLNEPSDFVPGPLNNFMLVQLYWYEGYGG